jgi:hypothetical protein
MLNRMAVSLAAGRWSACVAAALGSIALLAAVPAEAKVFPFTALLNAPQEVPPTASSAQGVAHMTFDSDTDLLCYAISYQGLVGAETMAHFHTNVPGVDGPIIFDISPMPPGPSPLGSPKSGCVGPLDSAQFKSLKSGLFYINIHSSFDPGGEIRGQVYPVKGVKF